MSRWLGDEGSPTPLGVSWVQAENAYNFALYSKDAEEVTLLLYADDPEVPVFTFQFDYLKNKSGRIWHCRIPKDASQGAQYYGYRVRGPATHTRPDVSERQYFDSQKILLDPYAAAVFFPPAFSREAAMQPGDNAGRAPLAFLCACEHEFDWRGDRRIRHEADTVIYELHVGGFTRNANSGVPKAARGTFAGLIEKIPYLTDVDEQPAVVEPRFRHDNRRQSVGDSPWRDLVLRSDLVVPSPIGHHLAISDSAHRLWHEIPVC